MEHHDIKASCANTLIYVAQCIFDNYRLHWSNSFELLHVSSWRRPTHCSESNQGTGRLVCTHLKHHHHHGRDDKQFENEFEVCTHLGNLAWRSPPQSWSHRPMSTCETNCWKSTGSLPSSWHHNSSSITIIKTTFHQGCLPPSPLLSPPGKCLYLLYQHRVVSRSISRLTMIMLTAMMVMMLTSREYLQINVWDKRF